jgi:hypothetical protein
MLITQIVYIICCYKVCNTHKAAVAYNLKKIMRWEGKKANTVVKALQKPLQNAFLIITAIIMRYYCLSKVTGKVNRNYFLSVS